MWRSDWTTFGRLQSWGTTGSTTSSRPTIPLLLDPAENADLIDRPVYRTQRMLYPLLSSAGGLLSGWAVVWGLIVVNLFAIALGTSGDLPVGGLVGGKPVAGTGLRSQSRGHFRVDHRWGRGAGLGAGRAGCLAHDRRQVLGRSVSDRRCGSSPRSHDPGYARHGDVVVEEAIGAGRSGWSPGLLSGAVSGRCGFVIQLGVPLLTSESEEIGLPFVGLGGAISRWIEEPGRNLLFGGAVVILLLLVVVMQAVRRPSLVSFSILGFVLMAPLLTRQVWLNYFDITRAIAPVFTTFVLVLFTTEPAEVTAGSHGD